MNAKHGPSAKLSGITPPVMIVLHGGPGWDSSYLQPSLDQLRDVVTPVYYDQLGSGCKPRPSQAEFDAIRIDTWVAELEAVRAHTGSERVLLFGHSFGGLIAQAYAIAYPQHVRGLVLCSTYPAFDYAEAALAAASLRATREQLAMIMEALTDAPMLDRELESVFRELLPIYFHEPRPEYFARFDHICYSAQAFAQGFGVCLPGYSTLQQLPNISTPTLVLAGGDDWIAPLLNTADVLARAIPNSRKAVFARSGHFPFIEEGPAFDDAMRTWLHDQRHAACD